MDNINYTQEQRSIEWFRARLGYITGSRVGVLMKTGKGKNEPFSATAKTYLYQVAGERALSKDITSDDTMLAYYIEQTTSTSRAMRFGTEQEENARNLYAEIKNVEVQEVGLCYHKELLNLASSPDGLVVDGGILGCLEIKCPTLSTYTQYAKEIKDNDSLLKVNPDYFYQCQNHMACTDTTFCDFVVYCPFLENPIHIVRIKRDDEIIKKMKKKVALAEAIVKENYNSLMTA